MHIVVVKIGNACVIENTIIYRNGCINIALHLLICFLKKLHKVLVRTITHERQYTQANEEGEPVNIANFRYNKRFTHE